jgi:hypothetical protein
LSTLFRGGVPEYPNMGGGVFYGDTNIAYLTIQYPLALIVVKSEAKMVINTNFVCSVVRFYHGSVF